tara:strand:+ start:2482 stop:3114 length:633 start_codon:yes stop_codon:yes gene_type:complete
LAIFTGGAMNGWFGSTATTSTGTGLTIAEANTINAFNAGAGAEGYAAAAKTLASNVELQAIATEAAKTGTKILGTSGGNILTNIPGKLASAGGKTLSSTAAAGGAFNVAPIVPTTLQKVVAVGGGTGASMIGTTAFQYGLSELQDEPEEKKYGTMAGLMQEEKTLAGTQGIGYTPTQTQFDINAGITPIRPLEYGVGAQPINITQKLGIV